MRLDGTASVGTALVVDPSRTNRFLIERTLAQAGFSVISAATGADALDAASQYPPDVTVIQESLPFMLGRDVCRELLNDSRTQHTYVIMISALPLSGVFCSARAAGAKDVLEHPLDPEKLKACAQKALAI